MKTLSRKQNGSDRSFSKAKIKRIDKAMVDLPTSAKEYASRRDKCDNALKLAASTLKDLEITIESGTRKQIDEVESRYDDLLDRIVELHQLKQDSIKEILAIASQLRTVIRESS